jgi:hypothetical protein
VNYDAVEAVWHDRCLVRWMMTRWCNWKCSYCDQEHARRAVYRGRPAHFADCASVDAWLAAFRRHFASEDLALCITGGEPMLDRRNVQPLLRGLVDLAYSVRIDTNGSWDSSRWDVPKDRIVLMHSYHPEHATEAEFLASIDRKQADGWTVAMATVVVLPDRFGMLDRLREALLRRDVALNCSPLDCSLDGYTPDQVKLLIACMPPADTYNKCGGNPHGMPCLYPSVAYEMAPSGDLHVACYRDRSGSLFAEQLPSCFTSYTACPHQQCTCLDRYTFRSHMGTNTGLTPIADYARRLKELPLCSPKATGC